MSKDIMQIWDEVIPYREDPRIQANHREFIKGNLGTFYYATRNIYLHKEINRLARDYIKIMKKKGTPISYWDSLTKVTVMLLNHEYMHKILFETVGIEESVDYDWLTVSKEFKDKKKRVYFSNSVAETLFNKRQDVLP